VLHVKFRDFNLQLADASCFGSTLRQLLANAKKFAREISDLKTKLAEKDAELAGGFGAPTKLALGELPTPGAPTLVPPLALPGQRPGSSGGRLAPLNTGL
jgi:hypothetical protein